MAQLTLGRLKLRSLVAPNETKVGRKQASLMRLVLKVVDTDQVISAPITHQLVIGRSSGSFHPDIDLLQLEGMKCGISRRHAAFIFEGTTLFVEDLNSTNGTRINGFKIPVGELFRLHNGDEVEFGQLRLLVRLMRAPA